MAKKPRKEQVREYLEAKVCVCLYLCVCVRARVLVCVCVHARMHWPFSVSLFGCK